jgi:hypothetical protein
MKLNEIHGSPDNVVVWSEKRGRLTTGDGKANIIFGIYHNHGVINNYSFPLNWTVG